MTWTKHGIFYKPDKSIGQVSHAQLPRGVQISEDTLRVFYTSRDKRGKSQPYFLDTSVYDLHNIEHVEPVPIIDLDQDYDIDGVMPCDVFHNRFNNTYSIKYIGWKVGADVPYHTSVAVAYGHVDKLQKLGQIPLRPYETDKTTAVECEYTRIMEYASYEDWITSQGKLEPIYRLMSPIVAEDECTCCPSFIYNHQTDDVEMFFSIRKSTDYRQNPMNSYRVVKARATEDFAFYYPSGIDIGEKGDFDSDMICYANVLYLNGRYVMLYNGNGFGRDGIAWAETDQL